MRTPAQNAELALLLEVAGTPKPGNVDRHHDYPDLRFEHFLAGAVGAQEGLRMAAESVPLGTAFERSVAGMSQQSGGNTQFGCLLLLVPLVRAATHGPVPASRIDRNGEGGRDEGALTRESATRVVEATTIADAVDFYCAFEHTDVAVADPPADVTDLDVRRGSAAAPSLEEYGLSLYEVMVLSARSDEGRIADGNAREWVDGFERTFRAAESMLADEGPVLDRVARAFLALLAEEPDTLVGIEHGPETAAEVRERAQEARAGDDLSAAAALADEFVDSGINPGTTADITAAATFVALERGLAV